MFNVEERIKRKEHPELILPKPKRSLKETLRQLAKDFGEALYNVVFKTGIFGLAVIQGFFLLLLLIYIALRSVFNF